MRVVIWPCDCSSRWTYSGSYRLDRCPLLAVFALFLFSARYFCAGCFCAGGSFPALFTVVPLVLRLPVVPIYVAKIPLRLDNVAYPPLQLLGLREAAVGASVPQDFGRDGGNGLGRRRGRQRRSVRDGDDKGAARGRLESDFAEGRGECGEEFLGVL